jgi:hypothetical protein
VYVKYDWLTNNFGFNTWYTVMKKKQIGKQYHDASLTGRFIFASDHLTAASLFLKAVIYVNCEHHTAIQSNHNLWY